MKELTIKQLTSEMALSKMMEEKDFANVVRAKSRLKRIGQMVNRRSIFMIHRDDGLVESEVSLDIGLKTFWLGDKTNKYVFVKLHNGVKLSGMVEVKMYMTEQDGMAKFVMDVWPITEYGIPFVGSIWMSDGFGQFVGCGTTPTFAVERLEVGLPFRRFTGTVNGFCFGLVLFDDLGFDSQVVVDNRMERIAAQLDPEHTNFQKALPWIITPFGAARGEVKQVYPIGISLPGQKPYHFSDFEWETLKIMYGEDLAIITERRVRRILSSAGIGDAVILKIVRRMEKMAKDGWFDVVYYEKDLYYIPTAKLLSFLK